RHHHRPPNSPAHQSWARHAIISAWSENRMLSALSDTNPFAGRNAVRAKMPSRSATASRHRFDLAEFVDLRSSSAGLGSQNRCTKRIAAGGKLLGGRLRSDKARPKLRRRANSSRSDVVTRNRLIKVSPAAITRTPPPFLATSEGAA